MSIAQACIAASAGVIKKAREAANSIHRSAFLKIIGAFAGKSPMFHKI